MKKSTKIHAISLAIASVALLSATSASAYSVTVGGVNPGDNSGLHTAVAGAVETTFDSGVLPANYTGGAVVVGSSAGHFASPPADTTHYFTVGRDASQPSPGAVTLSAPSIYFGYFGGSPDAYNKVELWNANSLLASFTGSELASFAHLPANGNWASGAYWNIWATNAEEYFTQVKFFSSSNAFETDNHASVSAVPLPASLPLLLSGLGVLGFARRKQQAEV